MSTEMKKLIIGGTEYEIVDDAGRARITALEQGGGTGLTQTEKNLLLTLFEKAAYAEDDAGTAYTALSNLWTGYTITWSGTGYTKSNSAASVTAGATFTSTLTANTGFTITNVVVTMGGNTVQGAWSNGTVTIPNVTGDIVITVTTAQAAVSSISAVYTQSGTVYDTDSLNSLKTDLVVTATFTDSTTGVIAAEDYTLSGTLAEGTSTITVSYGGQTATFTVTVTHYTALPLYDWDLTESLTDTIRGQVITTTGTLTSGTGLVFTAENQYADLGGIFAKDRTYEFAITAVRGGQTGHRRLLMSSSDENTARHGNGLIFAPTQGGFTFYNGRWANIVKETTTISDVVGIYSVYIDGSGYQTLYKDGVLCGTSSTVDSHSADTHVFLGGSGTDYTQATYSYLKIYEGEVISNGNL